MSVWYHALGCPSDLLLPSSSPSSICQLTCMGGFPCNHCLCKNRGCTKALINNPNEAPRTGHFALPPECVPSFMSAVARAVDSQAIMEAVGELAMARTRQGLIHRTRMVAHL